MLRLSSSFSRKIPGDEQYSSLQYHSSVEVELPTGMSEQQLRSKIHETFELVERAVEDEIAGRTGQSPVRREERSQHPQGRQQRDNNGGRNRDSDSKITSRQVNFILSLGKELGIGLPELNRRAAELYRAGNVYDLSKRDASGLLKSLQEEKAAA